MRHLYQNSEMIFSAESLEECDRLFTEDIGDSPADVSDTFEQIPDDQEIEVVHDDPTGDPSEYTKPMKNSRGDVLGTWYCLKKTAGAWAEEFGSGHFSGGDY